MKTVIASGKLNGTKTPQPQQKEIKLLNGVTSKNWGPKK